MLVRSLVDEFQHTFERDPHPEAVLWFDPDEEYTALLEHLNALDLWRYDGSLLRLRYRLIQRPHGERPVVYLPIPMEEAEVLRPFFGTSHIFRQRLYKFLRQQGVAFPDDPEIAHELRSLLPRLAARSVGKGRAFWEHNLANLERARETLLGNFEDALLKFLARPRQELQTLQREKLDGLFFAQLESTYGFSATSDNDAETIAQRLTARLILTHVHQCVESILQEHGHEMIDFPYAERVAEPVCRRRCSDLVTRWQHSMRYVAAYVRLAEALQSRYDLTRWILRLPDALYLTVPASFPNVQDAQWQAVQDALTALESEDDWRNWLSHHDDPLNARAEDLWARRGSDPGWTILGLARDLLVAIEGLRQTLDRWIRPSDALRDYARGWYVIDQDYRQLRAALAESAHAHDRVRDRCARSYRDILRRMNDRFSTLLEQEDEWPPKDESLPPQDRFWADAVADREGQIAVVFVDALRYELAQELLEALEAEGAGDQQTLSAQLAVAPTVTAMGMAALLPGGDRRHVDYDGGWNIAIDDSGNLRDKSTRQRWLKRHRPGAQFYNLDELVNTPTDQIPPADVYFVFDTTLDAVGENASKLAWNAFGALLQSVKKGVHKLLALGVDRVHVVTDHGFLLLDEVGEHDKVSVRDVPALARKSRYVVGHRLGYTNQLSFPVPHSEDLEAWFPRGIGCFRTPGPYNYVHGGLSLQELVVPHLQIEQKTMGKPVAVTAEFPTVIRNAQPEVRIHPDAPAMFDRPRQVSLILEKDGEPVLPPLSQVVSPADSAKVSVFLPMGCGLQPGDQVRWVLRDAVTEEILAEQAAVSQVDLW
jgi:hypothetical protein